MLHQSGAGYFLCHRSLSEEMCGRPYNKNLFDIRTPFLKDQEAVSIAQEMEIGVSKKRKRKKNFEVKQLPIEESTVLAFLSELSSFFQPSPSPLDFYENNRPARNMVTQFLSSVPGLKIQDFNLQMSCGNSSGQTIEKDIDGEIFILPPYSQFYKKDVGYLDTLAESGRTFSLVVMDPPWTNRFVKRKRHAGGVNSYKSMDNDILATLPISRLCTEGALVAVWCTNSKTHLHYLTNILLPLWDLTYEATWFWIKITKSGKFICPWNGPSGKHPFERVILARKVNSTKSTLGIEPIPDKKLIVSIPCAIHSFKPPLQKLLFRYTVQKEESFPPSNDQGLELFARSLLPGWCSLGNQVPLLQHASLFEDKNLQS